MNECGKVWWWLSIIIIKKNRKRKTMDIKKKRHQNEGKILISYERNYKN